MQDADDSGEERSFRPSLLVFGLGINRASTISSITHRPTLSLSLSPYLSIYLSICLSIYLSISHTHDSFLVVTIMMVIRHRDHGFINFGKDGPQVVSHAVLVVGFDLSTHASLSFFLSYICVYVCVCVCTYAQA